MEEDDGFGDLYTDIVLPAPQLPASSSFAAPAKPAPLSDPARPHPASVRTQAVAAGGGFNWEEDDSAADGGDSGPSTGLARVSGIGGDSEATVIPGLALAPALGGGGYGGGLDEDGGEDESDSEDDLQIVLNDNANPIATDRRAMQGMGDEDDDEDGDDLVIVTGDDVNMSQPTEEQEGGDEAGSAAGEGERKDGADAAKANGGVAGAVGARIEYSNHTYNPHHSQFKYVRPGASVASGSAASSGGAFNQVSPPGTIGLVSGQGRGDWRPMGNKGMTSLQRNFYPGYNTPWGSSARSFGGGMEFTLPSHKTVFDVDIDSFEEKPWKLPGMDISDFFNFGLDEDSWRSFCKQLEQFRLEATMQSKIRVYESGRSEQDYDPDLPPELAAAAGLHGGSTENVNIGKVDSGQADTSNQGKTAAHIRPQLPTGRAIQVETGYGERLPSTDTRPPRNRDLDVIIEIVLHDDANDNSVTSNGTLEQPADESQGEDSRGDDDGDTDHVTSPYGDKKKETFERFSVGGPKHSSDEDLNTVSDAAGARPSSDGQEASGDQTPSYEERLSHDRNEQDASPVEIEAVRELSVEQNDGGSDDRLALANSIEAEGEEWTSDLGVSGNDEESGLASSVKKYKLSSMVEPAVHEMANGHEMRPSNSDSSKPGSGSSRHYQKSRGGGDEEVMQDGQLRRIREPKRMRDDDKHGDRRDDYYRDSRKDMDRNRTVSRGREDISNPHVHRDYGVVSGHYARPKIENFERQERDVSVRSWQRKDGDIQGRKRKSEEIRSRDRTEETGMRHRSKFHENDRLEEDHQFMRKRGDDGDWRNRHEKDMGPRFREREVTLMGRHEAVDDSRFRRRKDEEIVKRDHEKEESLHGYRGREDRRKHERAEMVGPRRRDDQSKLRQKTDENHNSVKKGEECWRQREKEDKHRSKQSCEGDKLLEGGRSKEESTGFALDKEYSHRDKRQQTEPYRKRDGGDELTLPYRGHEGTNSRESQSKDDGKNPRNDRSSRQKDLANKETRKQNSRKGKERGGNEQNTIRPDLKEQDGREREKVRSRIVNEVNVKSVDCNGDCRPISTGSSSRFHRSDQDKFNVSSPGQEDAVSDEELQHNSKRGRSKLERWASNKERDVGNISEDSKAPNEMDQIGDSVGVDILNKVSEVTTDKNVDGLEIMDIDNLVPDFQTMEPEKIDNDPHSDTVAKLRKRSERFKLPMPGEKDTSVSRKVETKRVAAHNEMTNETEIKQERPARKRRAFHKHRMTAAQRWCTARTNLNLLMAVGHQEIYKISSSLINAAGHSNEASSRNKAKVEATAGGDEARIIAFSLAIVFSESFVCSMSCDMLQQLTKGT